MIIQNNSIRLIHQHFIDGYELQSTVQQSIDRSLSPTTTPTTESKKRRNSASNKKPTQQQQQPPKQPKKQLTKKSVHFDLTHNQVCLVEPVSESEAQQRWFSSKDAKGFRSDASGLGKRTLYAGKDVEAKQSFVAVLVRMFQEGSLPSDNDNDSPSLDLTEWEECYVTMLQQQPELMGMERFCMDATLRDKGRRRRQQLLVLHQQPKQQPPTTGFGAFARRHMADTQAAMVQHSCHAISRPTRQFAQRLAQIQVFHL